MSASIDLENNSNASTETDASGPLVESIFTEAKEVIAGRHHLPVSTYRIQFNRTFTFQQAREQVEYLKGLGISDLYASPYFKARAESMHGYDITDHNSLNPSIGDQEDYDRMVEELHKQGMFQLIDIVPNHMGIGETNNSWWMDVLENGPASVFAPYFDIDWHPLKNELENKVLLPILGDMYGKVLENKELQLGFVPETGTIELHYYEKILPVNPRSYLPILELGHEELVLSLGEESEAGLEFQSILTSLRHLPKLSKTDHQKVVERNREKEVVKRRLAALCAQEPRIQSFVEHNITVFNGEAGNTKSFNMLADLLDLQAYRLSYWRVASEEINYRRFFDVNDLAAVRVEVPFVFEETHRTILKLVREGMVNGLRVDHVDGLRNPLNYMENLQKYYFREIAREILDRQNLDGEDRSKIEKSLLERFDTEVSSKSGSPLKKSLYVVVEKILSRTETMPLNWPVYGTTGYDFTNQVNEIFVDNRSQKAFDQIYSSFIGDKRSFADLMYEKKKLIMNVSLASEVNVLTNILNQISEHDRYYRDYTLKGLRNAIREVIACFPVYRTYITPVTTVPDKSDQAVIESAIRQAKRRNPSLDPSVFDFIRDVLLLKHPDYNTEEDLDARLNFVLKFQQCTGPVIAKGLEDTSFYIYNRLISLNEVGGEPDVFGLTPAQFHKQQQERQRNWPYALLATSTHDTKRSEDVRARINVLSEIPKEWRSALSRWSRLNRRKKVMVDGQPVPSRNEEYFLYQTLLGIWPFGHDLSGKEAHAELVGRVQEYVNKAMKEAKVNTSWVNQNVAYEEGVAKFINQIMDPSLSEAFLKDFTAFQKKIAHYGIFNSLSQALLKLTSPGVPDIYQGCELWDLSLVDPDNRRPVDYELRQGLLNEVSKLNDAAGAAALLETSEDGRIKLFVTSRTLCYRQEHRHVFEESTYIPLEAQGPRQNNICAFLRSSGDEEIITVVPRLLAGLSKTNETGPAVGAVWSDSFLVLPPEANGQKYRNIYTGELIETAEIEGKIILKLDQVLGVLPVALLEKEL